jgi:hypothetical protein
MWWPAVSVTGGGCDGIVQEDGLLAPGAAEDGLEARDALEGSREGAPQLAPGALSKGQSPRLSWRHVASLARESKGPIGGSLTERREAADYPERMLDAPKVAPAAREIQ